LSALFFQVLRKYSGGHSENRVNAYKSLREKIIQDTLAECKQLMPDGTPQQWQSAMNFLSQRITAEH
jgi:hypothetical protein